MTLSDTHLRRLLLSFLLLSLVACSPRTRQANSIIQDPFTMQDSRVVSLPASTPITDDSNNQSDLSATSEATSHRLAQSNLMVSNQVISSTPTLENTVARATRGGNSSNLATVNSLMLNRQLHYHSTNDRFLTPLELHLKQIDTLVDNYLALVYTIANPSNAARIIDPRGTRSQGNMLLDAAGNTYPARSTLTPIVIPAGTHINYTVIYAIPELRGQIIVRAGLDDVSDNVASTLAPFALSLNELLGHHATETMAVEATSTEMEEVNLSAPIVVVEPTTASSSTTVTTSEVSASMSQTQTPPVQTPSVQMPPVQMPQAPRYPDIQNVMDSLLSSFDEPIALNSKVVHDYAMQNILAFDNGISPLMVRLERIAKFENGIWRFYYSVYNGTNNIHAVRLDPSQSEIRDNTGQSYSSNTLGAGVDLQAEERRSFYLDYQVYNANISTFDMQLGLKDLSSNVIIRPFRITLPGHVTIF